MEKEIIDEEELTEFQKAVHAYRAAGFRDHAAVLDFIDERDEIQKGKETAQGRFRIYPYLNELNDSQRNELYDSVLERFEEKVKYRLRR